MRESKRRKRPGFLARCRAGFRAMRQAKQLQKPEKPEPCRERSTGRLMPGLFGRCKRVLVQQETLLVVGETMQGMTSLLEDRLSNILDDPEGALPWPCEETAERIAEVREQARANGQDGDFIEIAVGLSTDASVPLATVPISQVGFAARGITLEEVGALVELLVAAIRERNEAEAESQA